MSKYRNELGIPVELDLTESVETDSEFRRLVGLTEAKKTALKMKTVLGSSGTLKGIAEVIDAFYMGEPFELKPGSSEDVFDIYKSGKKLSPVVAKLKGKFVFGVLAPNTESNDEHEFDESSNGPTEAELEEGLFKSKKTPPAASKKQKKYEVWRNDDDGSVNVHIPDGSPVDPKKVVAVLKRAAKGNDHKDTEPTVTSDGRGVTIKIDVEDGDAASRMMRALASHISENKESTMNQNEFRRLAGIYLAESEEKKNGICNICGQRKPTNPKQKCHGTAEVDTYLRHKQKQKEAQGHAKHEGVDGDCGCGCNGAGDCADKAGKKMLTDKKKMKLKEMAGYAATGGKGSVTQMPNKTEKKSVPVDAKGAKVPGSMSTAPKGGDLDNGSDGEITQPKSLKNGSAPKYALAKDQNGKGHGSITQGQNQTMKKSVPVDAKGAKVPGKMSTYESVLSEALTMDSIRFKLAEICKKHGADMKVVNAWKHHIDGAEEDEVTKSELSHVLKWMKDEVSNPKVLADITQFIKSKAGTHMESVNPMLREYRRLLGENVGINGEEMAWSTVTSVLPEDEGNVMCEGCGEMVESVNGSGLCTECSQSK